MRWLWCSDRTGVRPLTGRLTMTSTTSKILTDVANHYNQLIVAHRKLDKEIEEKYNANEPDQVIKALKLNKLHLKQEIEEIKSNLQVMIS